MVRPAQVTAPSVLDRLAAEIDSQRADAASPTTAPAPEPVLPPDSDKPPDAPEWAFPFSFTDSRGKVWAGDFKTKILTHEDRHAKSVLRARMLNGLPLTSFDPTDLFFWDACCHMRYSLVEKPKWAENLMGSEDREVVYAVWEKVNSHIVYYFRLDQDPSPSKGA